MSHKGNILLVANWSSNVGYAWWLMENFWITIQKHFETDGKSCFLIYPEITQIPESINATNINVFECNFRDRSFMNMRKLHKIIKSNSIQFIYLTDSPTYSLFYVLLRIWGVKKIVVHDHTPGQRTPATLWRRLAKNIIQRIPFYTADHFIAVTDYIFKRFIEVNCTPKNKCSIAQNGIKPIDLNKADFEYARHTFNIPEDRLIVVTTGRASYYKGIDFFIKCADELVNAQNNKQLHFLFCGDGPDLNDFKALVQQYNLEEFFTFAGKRTDVRNILPSCDIGFHASKGEVGYSLSILEYMSAGLATIVPDNDSTSGATKHQDTGLLYTPGNIESACDAITYCIDDGTRKSLSTNAVKEITSHYTIEETNKQLISSLDRTFS